MLSTNGRRRIIAVVGADEQSRSALKEVRRWQELLRCRVEVLLVSDRSSLRRTGGQDQAASLCAWARNELQLALGPDAVVPCAVDDVAVRLEQAHASRHDLVVCPVNQDSAASIAALPVHAVWDSVSAYGASMLLSSSQRATRRVLVVTDGTPRTLPVLQSAFALAEDFDIQLSHVDMRTHKALTDEPSAFPRSLTPAGRSALAYTRLVHGLVKSIRHAQHDVRPDLLLLGASADGGGGLASALCATPMPCSALIVPL